MPEAVPTRQSAGAESAGGRPRLAPGRRSDIGLVADVITRVLGLATGSTPPNLFTTLARYRKGFVPWLRFAGTLMPGGTLPRRETELVIVRVAERMGCAYEAEHHDRLAREAGLSDDDLRVARDLTSIPGDWPDAEAAVLRAVDEFGADGVIGDATWATLARDHTEGQLIELCLLIGHYEMLAKTINTLRIEPDGPPTKPIPGWIRRAEKLLSRGG